MANSRRRVADDVDSIVRSAIQDAMSLEHVREEMLDRAAEAVGELVMHSFGLIEDLAGESGETTLNNPQLDWEFRRAGE